MDKSTACWKNVPAPNRGTVVSVFGTCSDVSSAGLLTIALDNIVYCPSTPQNFTTSSGDNQDSNKQRKFGSRVRNVQNAATGSLSSQSKSSIDSSSYGFFLSLCACVYYYFTALTRFRRLLLLSPCLHCLRLTT